VLPPTQIAEFVELAVTVGNGLTVTPTVAVFTQPLAFVPVTVYVVLAVGDTVTDEPDKLPGFHTYVEAPLALNEVLPPTQIAEFAELAVTVGNGLTVTPTVAVFTQPLALVPVTVYVVVVVGDTVTDEPDKLPGFHT
jgi:LysM repeat protein